MALASHSLCTGRLLASSKGLWEGWRVAGGSLCVERGGATVERQLTLCKSALPRVFNKETTPLEGQSRHSHSLGLSHTLSHLIAQAEYCLGLSHSTNFHSPSVSLSLPPLPPVSKPSSPSSLYINLSLPPSLSVSHSFLFSLSLCVVGEIHSSNYIFMN